MANTYSPPPTIDFFGAGFTSGLIYYNNQLASADLTYSTSTGYATITAFSANAVTIPVAGDYIITWNTSSFGSTSNRAFYQFICTHASQVFTSTVSGGTLSSGNTTVTVASTTGFPSSGVILIDSEEISYTGKTSGTFTGCSRGLHGTLATSHSNGATVTYILVVGDRATAITYPGGFATYYGSWSRKVTFPVSGAWTLTPKWKTDGGSISVQQTTNNDYFRMVVLVHAINSLDVVNQQLTKFVNSSYTLMTNVDANAWWGNLTTTQVAQYGTDIATLNSSVSSLSGSVGNLQTNVTNLSNTVSGLTSISVTSGGIRIKP